MELPVGNTTSVWTQKSPIDLTEKAKAKTNPLVYHKTRYTSKVIDIYYFISPVCHCYFRSARSTVMIIQCKLIQGYLYYYKLSRPGPSAVYLKDTYISSALHINLNFGIYMYIYIVHLSMDFIGSPKFFTFPDATWWVNVKVISLVDVTICFILLVIETLYIIHVYC